MDNGGVTYVFQAVCRVPKVNNGDIDNALRLTGADFVPAFKNPSIVVFVDCAQESLAGIRNG